MGQCRRPSNRTRGSRDPAKVDHGKAAAIGKYVFPKGFRKELVLYNYDRAEVAIREFGMIIVEGFFSVMALYEAGYKETVAVMGSEVSDAQAAIAGKAKEVIPLFDGDEAGRKGTVTARDKLAGKTTVRIVHLPEGSKPDSISTKTLRWALNGMRALGLSELRFTFHV